MTKKRAGKLPVANGHEALVDARARIKMTPTGCEQARQYSTFRNSSECAAPCAALEPDFGPIDPELAVVIRRWAHLSEATRAEVLSMVRADRGTN